MSEKQNQFNPFWVQAVTKWGISQGEPILSEGTVYAMHIVYTVCTCVPALTIMYGNKQSESVFHEVYLYNPNVKTFHQALIKINLHNKNRQTKSLTIQV